MRCAKTTENYWNTLTASYREYGFQAVVDYQPDPPSDDNKEEEAITKIKEEKNSNTTTTTTSTSTETNTTDNKQNDFDHESNGNNGLKTPLTPDRERDAGRERDDDRKQSAKKKLTLKATPSQTLLRNMKKRVLSGSPTESARKRRKLNPEVL